MESRSRKRGIRKTVLAVLFRIALFIGLLYLLWQAFGIRLFGRWLPSEERKDLTEWFEVEGDRVRLYLDGQMEDELTGLYRFDQVYLPCAYVADQVNARFFLNSDRTVSMTLPGEELLFDAHSYRDGTPVLIQEGTDTWILLDAVEEYSDLTSDRFTGEADGPCRVFLHTGGTEGQYALLKKQSAVRTRTSQTAPVLDKASKGEQVILLEEMEGWSRVYTDAGVIGYLPAGDLVKDEAFTWPDTWEMPAAEHHRMEEKVVMGWHSLAGTAANAYLEDLLANTGGAVNVICPTWIQISDADGNYENYSGESYIEKAHEAGVSVWACVDNFNQPGGVSEFSTKEYFSDRKKRGDFIRRLMEDAERFGYDGINLDFEGVPQDAGPAYVQMIRELSNACRDAGVVLSVDNYVPYTYNKHYELAEQALYADYVIIMGYDEHTGKDIGSVSSQPWLEEGIRRALAEVPAEQLIGAVPFYTRSWETGSTGVISRAMGMQEADRYVAQQEIPLSWDESCGQFYGKLAVGAVTLEIWMEDITSLSLKSDFLKDCDLGGVAAWRLGYEPSEVWEILDWNGHRKDAAAAKEAAAEEAAADETSAEHD